MESVEPASSRRFTHCIAKPEPLIGALFPLQPIFGPEFSLDALVAAFLHDNSRRLNTNAVENWREWDILKKLYHQKQEEAVAGFFQCVAQFAYEFQLTKLSSPQKFRIWTAGNKDRSAHGADVKRKPDVVGVDSAVSVLDDWRHFQVVGEIKSVEVSDSRVYRTLHERAATMFRHQDSRRFVLCFALVKHQMTIAFFDRGGSVFSNFNIRDQPQLFFQSILGLSFSSDEFIGYDTTITTSVIRLINSRVLQHVILHCTLFLADRMEGRGTVVWLGRLLVEAESSHLLPGLILSHISGPEGLPSRISIPIVIKDTWIDEKNSVTEGIILALLNHKGVKGIPRIIAEEGVPAPLPPSWPKDKDYPRDSTTVNRCRLNIPTDAMCLNDAAQKKAQETSGAIGFAPRVHVRQYATPYAISIFQFRSGVELLGIIADVLTSHEQAASDYYEGLKDAGSGNRKRFPFRFLHRDPSSRNLGMVPQTLSDHDPCPLRKNGEYRGLLFDWGFTAIAIADVGTDSSGVDDINRVDEADVGDEVITEEGFISLPQEEDADCGIYTATPHLIGKLEHLVNIVLQCMAIEHPELGITGTLPYMSIELLDASIHGEDQDDDEPVDPMHSIRHDLEGFYMVLISLCILFEHPHKFKNLCASTGLRVDQALPEPIIAWLTNRGPMNEYALRDRFTTFGTSLGLSTKIFPILSPYFRPMGPYLENIRELIYGNHEWSDGRYKCPSTSPTHDEFRRILHSAMENVPQIPNNSDFAKIVDPPEGVYLPIQPDGTWVGGVYDRKNPMIQSNNAFGYFKPREAEISNPVVSPPPTYTFVDSSPESYQKEQQKGGQHQQLRKTYPSLLYPLVPSVKTTSTTKKPRKKVRRTLKPFSANPGGTRTFLAVKLRKLRDQYQKGRNVARV